MNVVTLGNDDAAIRLKGVDTDVSRIHVIGECLSVSEPLGLRKVRRFGGGDDWSSVGTVGTFRNECERPSILNVPLIDQPLAVQRKVRTAFGVCSGRERR